MPSSRLPIPELLDRLDTLPDDWHRAGLLGVPVLREIWRHLPTRVDCTAETGTGRSTLFFSHVSARHHVFALDMGESLNSARSSDLLYGPAVAFVEGPSQRTLPGYDFPAPLDCALVDGAHAFPFPFLDYWCLYPRLAPGGLLVVDDIHIPTINWLFQFLREEPMFELVSVVIETAIFRRTHAPTFDPFGEGWWLQRYNDRRFPVQHDGRSRKAERAPLDGERYRTRLLPLVARWREAGTRVAIFGTGPHTRELLVAVPELRTTNLVAFLDSRPSEHGTRYEGTPVVSPDWASTHVDVVLCSSYEHELTQVEILDAIPVKVVLSHRP